MTLKNKKILIIVGGGISAYKSLDLIRLLKKENVDVKTILTKSGKEFVTPLSLTTLTKSKTYEDIFDKKIEAEIDHISLSRWADLIVVMPTTANFMSKLSIGRAEDLATTVLLASNKDVLLVPAMNVRMWLHKATQRNLKILQDYGYNFIGPEKGEMACGEFGEGKMSSPRQIYSYLKSYFHEKNLVKNKNKIKKEKINFKYLNFIKNNDILEFISKNNKHRPSVVAGFSAETENLKKNSISKLKKKHCDIIFANDVSQKDIGFNSDYNKISVIDKTGSIKIIPKSKKSFIAKKIVEILLDKLLINDRNIN